MKKERASRQRGRVASDSEQGTETVAKSQDELSGGEQKIVPAQALEKDKTDDQTPRLQNDDKTKLKIVYTRWINVVDAVAIDITQYQGKCRSSLSCWVFCDKYSYNDFYLCATYLSTALLENEIDAAPVEEISDIVLDWLLQTDLSLQDIPRGALQGPPIQMHGEYDIRALINNRRRAQVRLRALVRKKSKDSSLLTATLAIDTTVPAGKRKANKAQDGLATVPSRKTGRYPAAPYRKAFVRVLIQKDVSRPAEILALLQEYQEECHFEIGQSCDLGELNANTISSDINYLRKDRIIRDKRDGPIRDNHKTIKKFKKWLETRDK